MPQGNGSNSFCLISVHHGDSAYLNIPACHCLINVLLSKKRKKEKKNTIDKQHNKDLTTVSKHWFSVFFNSRLSNVSLNMFEGNTKQILYVSNETGGKQVYNRHLS